MCFNNWAMRSIAAVLFCLMCLDVTGAPMSQIEAQLTAKEALLADLYAQYWSTQYEIDRGNSKLSATATQERIRQVEEDPEFLSELKAAKFSDPIVQRRQQMFLRETAVTEITADPSLAKLVESITRDESAMQFDVGGKKLPRSEVNNLLGHNSDRELRRQAWQAQEQLTAITGERIREAMKMRIALAKGAGESFPDLMLAFKGIRSKQQVMDWFDDIQRQTEPEYQNLLARIRKELKIETVEPWDLDYYFSTLTSGFETKKFVPERAQDQVKRLAALLGFDFNKLPITTTITEITFGGGTYPIRFGKDVRILVNKYEGLRFVDTLFHESGHGLHYSFEFEPQSTDSLRPSFILESNSAEPLDEGLGQVVSLMIYRPQFAAALFGLTSQESTAINEFYRLKSLYDMRSTIADSMFEFAAYDKPDQDLAALYDRISEKYLGVPMHSAKIWAYDPFYSSGPIYLQSYVLAEMVGRQVHHALMQKFGDQWGPDAGTWLREKLFVRGGRLTLDEIMEQGSGEALTDKYLIAAMLEH